MTSLATALNAQGLKLLTAGNRQRAMDFFHAAIAQDSDLADAYTNLGVALYMERQYDDAVAALRQSLTLRLFHAETLFNLGHALWAVKDMQGAKLAFQQAIEIDDMPLAHVALGAISFELADDDLAIKHSRIGLQHDPDNIVAHNTLRGVYQFRGDEAQAWAACNKLVELAPDYAEHRLKRALVMLTYGKPEGWAEHECRYDTSPDGLSALCRENPQYFAKLYGKRWQGQRTGHLVIQTEQGFGDVVQFLRYIPLAAERCSRITLLLPAALRRLAGQTFKHLNVEVGEYVPDDFDHYCLIMSLGYLLDRTEDIPPPPYLTASPYKYDEIRRLDGMKIGLVWNGSEKHPENQYRCMPFEKMARLLDLPAQFVSLQYPCKDDLRGYPINDVHLIPSMFEGNLLVDWTETAALVNALDLVISTDTAVPHLAGALGKPVWLLNRYNSDWRWMLHRSDTPWYPNMTIFRQPKMGDWDSVLDVVHDKLAGWLRDHRT